MYKVLEHVAGFINFPAACSFPFEYYHWRIKMNNNNFQNNVNKMGDDIVDTAASAIKQVLGAGSSLIGGAQKTLNNGLVLVDSAISDVAVPTVESLRNMGINTTKSAVKLGYDTVKDVAGSTIEGGKTIVSELKKVVPKGNTSIQKNEQAKPQSREDQYRFIAEPGHDLHRFSRNFHPVRITTGETINSQPNHFFCLGKSSLRTNVKMDGTGKLCLV